MQQEKKFTLEGDGNAEAIKEEAISHRPNSSDMILIIVKKCFSSFTTVKEFNHQIFIIHTKQKNSIKGWMCNTCNRICSNSQ